MFYTLNKYIPYLILACLDHHLQFWQNQNGEITPQRRKGMMIPSINAKPPPWKSINLSSTQEQWKMHRLRSSPADYTCSDLVTYSSTKVPVCEPQKFSNSASVSLDCLTWTLKANSKIRHPLQPNVWLFTCTHTTPAPISCDDAPGRIQDVQIIGFGTRSSYVNFIWVRVGTRGTHFLVTRVTFLMCICTYRRFLPFSIIVYISVMILFFR